MRFTDKQLDHFREGTKMVSKEPMRRGDRLA